MAVCVAAVVSTAALSTGSRAARAWPDGCPRHPVADAGFTSGDFAAAARAVHEQIPRVFEHLSTQGKPAWPHATVSGLVSVAHPPLGRAAHSARVATKACGKAVADASLVAFLGFPGCQIPCDAGFAFVTRTRRGWALWTPYRD